MSLPQAVQDAARHTFELWLKDRSYRALDDHALSGKSEGWRSVKISMRYVAVYRVVTDAGVKHYVWDWVGTHEAFNKEFPR